MASSHSAQVVSARILNAVSRTGVGCEVFVPLGFVTKLQRGYSCAWRAGAGRCGVQLLFICEMEGMIQGFVVAIWTASLVTIGREHRFWHNSERVAQ